MFHDSYFTRLVHGATNAAAAADNMLALFLFESDREATELYPKAADNGLLDGLVVWASVASGLLVSLSAKSRIPFVTVGHPGTATVPYVEVEHYTGAVTGTRHLIGHGRREIAHLAVPLRTSAGAERRRGYLDAMSEAELKVGAGRVAEGDSTTGGGYRAMTELLDSRPDAVFCASDQMALGALRALDHAGVRCPDDVAVVSFDGLLAADEIDPPLTTVAQPVDETGEAAVQVLLEVLEGTRRVPSRLLPTELIVRSTCGCRSDPEQPGVPTDGSLHLGSESREP
jgi:DNA-binding LacI/PurR family transcriptional regulator